MQVLIIISGRGKITGKSVEPVDFKPGDTLLIPADFEGVSKFSKDTEYLAVTPTARE